ncbi:solute carrier family 22 member [Holotrichia oblita]|uniref:Solute carrier family 22 member n=1 Tax=Holotrichia oblita TaxID=644536 RepID=A0ACB9TJK9_HOLOL|nr:solute carrier family 22 member [Holotrichia oblita]
MVFAPEHDAFILKAHYRSGTRDDEGNWNYSLPSCIEQFAEAFPDFDIDYDALKYYRHLIVHRFEERHCICKKKSTGRPTKLSEDVLDNIRERMERSPQKSVPKLANQTGIIYMILAI